MSSCCPPSAWGELKNGSYTAKGVVEAVGDLNVYRVGESSKCIIWNYDVFGFDGGRTRQMADFLADQGEFPTFFTLRTFCKINNVLEPCKTLHDNCGIQLS